MADDLRMIMQIDENGRRIPFVISRNMTYKVSIKTVDDDDDAVRKYGFWWNCCCSQLLQSLLFLGIALNAVILPLILTPTVNTNANVSIVTKPAITNINATAAITTIDNGPTPALTTIITPSLTTIDNTTIASNTNINATAAITTIDNGPTPALTTIITPSLTTIDNIEAATTIARPPAGTWETCCINSTTGLQYNCHLDKQNYEVKCALGDNEYIDLLCLRESSPQKKCQLTYKAPFVDVMINGKSYSLKMGGESSSFLLIQQNNMTNGMYFQDTLRNMEKVIANGNQKDGNFWIGLDLMSYFTNIPNVSVSLEINIIHTVNNDAFSVHYDSFNVAPTTFKLAVSGFSFSDAVSGITIKDALAASSPADTIANNMNFQGVSGLNCANTQNGGWWMGSGCSHSNLNSADGEFGWQYSTTDATLKIKFSMMGIGFP